MLLTKYLPREQYSIFLKTDICHFDFWPLSQKGGGGGSLRNFGCGLITTTLKNSAAFKDGIFIIRFEN